MILYQDLISLNVPLHQFHIISHLRLFESRIIYILARRELGTQIHRGFTIRVVLIELLAKMDSFETRNDDVMVLNSSDTASVQVRLQFL